MIYAQPRICPGDHDAQTPQGFCDKNGSPNLSQTTRPCNNQQQQKKKRTYRIEDFAISAAHRVKLKESEKKDKYHDLARELKKLWSMKMTVIKIAIEAFSTATKALLQGREDLDIRGQVEAVQSAALLKSAGILRRVLETWGDFLSLKPQWETIG